MSRVIIASAGSGKTTSLVEEAIARSDRRILLITYTIENTENLREAVKARVGYMPEHIEISSWFSFLLSEGARPYQNLISSGPRASGINFVSGSSHGNSAQRFTARSEVERYYFDIERSVFSDRLSDLVCRCDDETGGRVLRRLRAVYDVVMIDEVQDLGGWDLDLLRRLFDSGIEVVAAGDPRQATYSTNNARKNKPYRGANIVNFFRKMEREGRCQIEHQARSWRCNQTICDLADRLYPQMERTVSFNRDATGHDGIFYVGATQLTNYVDARRPVALRYRSDAQTHGVAAVNFGTVKGLTFDHVLIFPTPAMKAFLERGEASQLKPGTRAKLYVAITRARHSVTFVCNPPNEQGTFW